MNTINHRTRFRLREGPLLPSGSVGSTSSPLTRAVLGSEYHDLISTSVTGTEASSNFDTIELSNLLIDVHPGFDICMDAPFGSKLSLSNIAIVDCGDDFDNTIDVAKPAGPPPIIAQSMVL